MTDIEKVVNDALTLVTPGARNSTATRLECFLIINRLLAAIMTLQRGQSNG